MNYKYDIQLYITHPSDCISEDKFIHQTSLFNESRKLINEYRVNHEMPEMTTHINLNSNFNGYMSNEDRKDLQKRLEGCFKWDLDIRKIDCVVDYYITTKQSTHQSHQECNKIALSVMRSPYIEKCRNIMLATYPQDVYGISMSDTTLNTFIPMTKEQVDLATHIIGSVYAEKNIPGSVLGADKFEEMLKYFGNVSNKAEYAQPFLSVRNILNLE